MASFRQYRCLVGCLAYWCPHKILLHAPDLFVQISVLRFDKVAGTMTYKPTSACLLAWLLWKIFNDESGQHGCQAATHFTRFLWPITPPLRQAVAVLWTICVLPNLKSVPSEYKHWKGARSIQGVLNRLSTHANTDINLRHTDMLPVKLPHGACPAKQKKTYY